MDQITRFCGVLLLLTTLAGCATNPVTGSPNLVLMSEEQEIALGLKTHKEVLKQYQVYDDPELQRMVDRLGQELAARSHRSHLDFTFTVLDSPQVNAFATPGGYIYITRGIMAYMNNEEELAGVLGHEIGHVTARHSVRQHSAQTVAGLGSLGMAILFGDRAAAQMSSQLGRALVSGYGRNHELEADRLGAEYLAEIGYDPEMMLGVVGILKDQEEFEKQRAADENRQPRTYHGVYATHPRNDQRLKEVIRAAERFKNPDARYSDPKDFLRKIEGITFGDSESQGVLRGNNFYHKPLDLHIRFPKNWRVENQPTQLISLGPNRQDAMLVKLGKQDGATTPEQFLRKNFRNLRNGQSLNDGSYTGITEGKTPFGQRPVRVAAKFHGNQVLVFNGFSKGNLNTQTFFNTVSSVRTLKRREKKLASTKKIKLVRAKRGDTFEKLSRRSSLDQYAVDQLRLLNGMYPDGEPVTGQLIKIIK
ncbi:MAG: M48 family metalloprotease [Acidiferrobacterales bacterium]|nr:M48 family metalloprotease [Acidiferrobacterales bacterium]